MERVMMRDREVEIIVGQIGSGVCTGRSMTTITFIGSLSTRHSMSEIIGSGFLGVKIIEEFRGLNEVEKFKEFE
ncbi:MAG: hypothetical protein QXH67_03700 [Candidatus Bathyarchaeia archaeon]